MHAYAVYGPPVTQSSLKTLINAAICGENLAGIGCRNRGSAQPRARDEHHNGAYLGAMVPIPNLMRAFSLIGLLVVVAIIGFTAKSYFQPATSSSDPNDKSSVGYWVAHNGDRTAMISFCQSHPQQQDSADCTLAIEAQTEVDSRAQQTNAAQNNTGVTSASGDANGQLQAQQDANSMGSGSP